MKLSWRPLSLMLCALLPLAMSGCATSSYMGIEFAPGAADPALQQLAQRARTGDKQAQLELAIAFEHGAGIERDLIKARKLYRIAASDSGGSIAVYVPGAGGVAGRIVTISDTVKRAGLIEASQRLKRISNEAALSSNQSSRMHSDQDDHSGLICRLIRVAQSESADANVDFRAILLDAASDRNPSVAPLNWSSEAIGKIFNRPVIFGDGSSVKYQAFLISTSGSCEMSDRIKNKILPGFDLLTERESASNGELIQQGDIFDVTPLIHNGEGYSFLVNLDKSNIEVVDAIAVIWE